MPRDFIPEDEWEMIDEQLVEPRVAKEKTPGKKSSALDYIIVALVTLIVVVGVNNFLYARTGSTGLLGGGSCCSQGSTSTVSSGGGGCCGGGGGAVALSNAELEQLGLDFYRDNSGDVDLDEVVASVEDFGCHQEVYIYKAGDLVMRVGYGNGQVYEIY